MAINLQQLRPFEATSNPAEAWASWRRDFSTYMKALKYHKEDNDTQVALFLHVCGDELKKHYNSFTFVAVTGEQLPPLEDVLEKFNAHYAAYKNLTFASFIFWGLNQKPDQTFDQFLTTVKKQADQCEFGTALDRNMKDKIIQGISDNALRERLLRDSTITLEKVVDNCKAAELSKTHATAMLQSTKNASVDALMKSNNARVQQPPQAHKKSQFDSRQRPTHSREQPRNSKDCIYCGRSHKPKNCPAFGSTCNACGKRNHWSNVCKSAVKNQHQRSVHVLEDQSNDVVFLGELKIAEVVNESDEWYQEIFVENHPLTFKLDTGAQVNVITEKELANWSPKPILHKSTARVSTFTGDPVPILGECYLKCRVKNKSADLKFHITSLPSKPILGAKACQELNIVQRIMAVTTNNALPASPGNNICKPIKQSPEDIIEEYADVFTGVGRLEGLHKIHIQPGIEPHVAAPRKIPLALQDKVRKELDRMLELSVIEKISEPTEWVNNIVVVEKGDKVRICLDPRPLNKAIRRPRYPLPTEDQLFARLQGCNIFSLLDAKDGFWHLQLEEASSKLTTFVTPWGRYRFLVMPFGLNCAPEEFQKAMDETFMDEPNVNPYFDDTPLGSKSVADHCTLLRRTLQIARQKGLKFNRDKLQLAKSSINFMGHVLTSEGIKPDPRKVQAIHDFPAPTDKPGLLRFLGMLTYLSKFTPHLSEATHALRALLKKDVSWIWDATLQTHFERAKNLLVSTPVLAYFNPALPLLLSVDASKHGLGAVLLQENRPVAYASATLTDTQQRYSQIEKELLAVVFGLERFDYYTYGRDVLIQTDHKPLLGLHCKLYDTVSPRLQRFLLRLNRYSVTLTYLPGKELIVADALSRAPSQNNRFEPVPEKTVDAKLHLLAKVSNDKLIELQKLSSQDADIQAVLQQIRSGWPENKKKVSFPSQQYWHCREELHEADGLLLRGHRLVIPKAAQPDILSKLHVAHRGIAACTSKARESLYWPRMTTDIQEFIAKCEVCQQFQRKNQREPLLDRDLPDRPWQKIAIDFFELQQKHYIIAVDYFSKYPEVQLMSSTTASAVINSMKAMYARFGIPEEVISDQGPPFSAKEMKAFHSEWGIRHNPSSPLYPRSNGQVERTVQTIKASLRKAAQDGHDLYTVLLDFRATPTEGMPSPSELLMGRKLRTQVPSHPSVLKPKFQVSQAKKRLQAKQQSQHRHADQHTKALSPLHVNDAVMFWHSDDRGWTRGIITKAGPQPRSYLVTSATGAQYQRNRYHLKPASKASRDMNCPSSSAEDYFPLRDVQVNTCQPKVVVQDHPKVIVQGQQSPRRQGHTVTRSGRVVHKPARFRD